ncbi:helix-turn-helix domain-containing protein [Parapedobacter sp. DT-150]|uniref:helix-turn-helix domain-containing protein n=1 Tax=Parapedobacter sp. DT-150 TaxID=3396162 RepID=UPI003F1D8FEB
MNNDNLSKFQQLVSGEDLRWVEKTKWRKENKEWLKKSALIALTVLRKLRHIGMTQKEFAEQLGVSAQHISKILKGRENLTLETICKMEAVLGVELASVLQYVTTAQVGKKEPIR